MVKSRSSVAEGLPSREVKLKTSLSYPSPSVENWKGTERGGVSMKVTLRLSTGSSGKVRACRRRGSMC